MKRVLAISLAVAMAGAGILAFGQEGGAVGGKVAITLGKDTTAVTGPVRADGTVDYVAALNAKYGAGVTAENNGFAKWLEVVGTGVIGPRIEGKFLQMLGMKATAAGAAVWEGYEAYWKRVKGGDNDADDKAHTELLAAAEGVWKESEHPDLAAFLKEREKSLAQVREAVGAAKWWMPMVAGDGRTVLSTLQPSLAQSREVTFALCARAALKAGNGDVNGALLDIGVVRRMARNVGNGPTLIERLVGIALEGLAIKTLGGIAASGELTEAQCKAMAATLDAAGPLPNVADGVDWYERWMMLDLLQAAAAGKSDLARIPLDDREDSGGWIFLTVERENVDWDAVLKYSNGLYNENLAAMRKPGMTEMRAANAAFDKRIEAIRTEVARSFSSQAGAKKGANETRAAYSDRVGKVFALAFFPNLGKSAELERRATQQVEMVRVVVAAAQRKATTGKWPATAEELVPGLLKTLPKDEYSANEAAPFRYVVRNGGVRVYTVGENGKDDGGVRDAAKDDIGVGAK